ncbi:MAG: type II toxin-antitoxin system RelE/ParE family toxin, partial [Bryobacterales bacterium]|nr:type II toxin-antitoxin system RelE/ParE family toxin [Bryobacterales bacterium]
AVFVYGFSKSQLENISKQEERAFREAAQFVLALSAKQLRALIERGDYMEVKPE